MDLTPEKKQELLDELDDINTIINEKRYSDSKELKYLLDIRDSICFKFNIPILDFD